jgi:hypothetical protein
MTTDPAGLIHIDGVPPSSQVRESMRGTKAILAFSRGKDSIAAWIAMRDAGIEVLPFYRYGVPGLQFAEDSLRYFEDHFGTRILRIPHVSFYRQIDAYMFQPPHRCKIIDFADLPTPDYREVNDLICQWFGVDAATTWICDGVRASDSPDRRRSISKYGPANEAERQVHIIWDWRVKTVWQAIRDDGITPPPDYEMNKRSFDGFQYQYIAPLKARFPGDYQAILDWFPLADLELFRRHELSRVHKQLPESPDASFR